MSRKSSALVVLSGGQDSTTCLFLARQRFPNLHAITFDYGQRHVAELAAAKKVATLAGVESHEFVTLPSDVLKGTSPLVSKQSTLEQYADFESLPGGLEKTFVPMRNQLFLTIAANRAHVLNVGTLITGVCEADNGGYPDCTEGFIRAFSLATDLGTFTGRDGAPPALAIDTPLMHLSKAQTVALAMTIPGAYYALGYTHTAYDGRDVPDGHDHASLLRAKGFAEAGVPDPLVLRSFDLGKLPVLPATPNYSPEAVKTARLHMNADRNYVHG